MMYLSQLLIDTGSNPDRPRPGRMWLNNVYNVHRRLSMAFPLRERKISDPDFLKPFAADGFNPRQFLFRVDNNIDGNEQRSIILVQSSLMPDWEYAFHNAQDFLVAPPQVKAYTPAFQAQQKLCYRILLNPSVKRMIDETQASPEGKIKTGRILHKRVSLTWAADSTPDQALADWFAAKSSRLGFTPLDTKLVKLGWVYGSKPEPKGEKPRRQHDYRPLRFRSALLEGYLQVDDPDLFLQTITKGIGSAKGLGFGLLSVMQE